MTGPEHYREAERLLGEANVNQFHQGSGDPVTPELLTAAQVHATLALAAAVGNNEASRGQTADESNAWYRTAGTKPENPEVAW